MHTEAINHEPAITFMQTGNQITGRPCLGSWALVRPRLAERQPADVRRAGRRPVEHTEQVQAISARLWSRGFLPAKHAGVSLRAGGDPILYINNPAGRVAGGSPANARRAQRAQRAELPDQSAIPRRTRASQQYELAFRMQASVPELTDLSTEPAARLRPLRRRRAQKPGTFANTALTARRMVERGVRFVQIYHNNWDTHANVAGRLPEPVQGRRPGVLRPDPGPEAARACSTRRWSSGAASSAARSTRRAA